MEVRLDQSDIEALAAAVAEKVAGLLEVNNGHSRIGFPEEEAAKLVGIPRHVLRDYRIRNKLPVAKLGRKVLWTRGQLEEVLRNSANGDGPPT